MNPILLPLNGSFFKSRVVSILSIIVLLMSYTVFIPQYVLNIEF